jgi:preprotein translocase subunit SecB
VEAVAHIDVTFSLTYSLTSLDEIDDEKVDAFGKMNAVYNAWPYVREFVQSTLARMGLPALTLPVLTSGLLTGIYEAKERTGKSEQTE